MDAVLSFAFDHAYVLFGGLIIVLLAVMWFAGRPNRWWKWLVHAWRGKDVVFLALTDEDAEVIRKFTAQYPIRASVARFTSDKPAGGIEAFVYQGRPTTMIIDREGRVSRRLIGMRTFEQFDEALRAAMWATSA